MTTTTNEHVQALREAYNQFVSHPDGHWKGEAFAVVDLAQADLVREAMNFHGSIVDDELQTSDGRVALYSRGYWVHGF